MIRLVPNDNDKHYDMNSEDWDKVWEYVQHLNSELIFPVLNEKDFIEVGIYQGYSFSSQKTKEMYNLLENSIQHGILEQYQKNYDDQKDLNNYTLFPIDKVIEFTTFCNYSGGFQINTYNL